MSQFNRKQATTVGLFLLALGAVLWFLFGTLTGDDPARTSQLLTMLKSPDAIDRLGAVTGLADPRGSAEVTAALEATLADDDQRVRTTAAWALWRAGRPDLATKGFDAQLKSPDSAIRMAAVRALRSLESKDSATLLRRAAGDPAAGIRAEAALGLVRINDEAGFDILGAALADIRPDHRVTAARSLAQIDDDRAVALAERLSKGEHLAAAALSEVVLVRWGNRAADSVTALPKALFAPTGLPADKLKISLCEAMGHLLTRPEFDAVPGAAEATAAASPETVRTACSQAAIRTKGARR